MAAAELTFPLVPRRRLLGLSFGGLQSVRRGPGSDVAGSRPYLPGDDVDTIDWHATARLSSARASDEFVVRERFAEEAPRVVIVSDRRPEMGLYPPELPWLSKPDAMRVVIDLLAESAVRARGFVGYVDCGDDEPFWHPPGSQTSFWEVRDGRVCDDLFRGGEDNVTRSFDYLEQLPSRVPSGSFVFVISDFLVSPTPDVWAMALERNWDVVPVVIQDPVWEQSFPDVASVVVPMADPSTGRLSYVRLTATEVRERRAANQSRRLRLLADLEAAGLDPISVDTTDREAVLHSFLEWAEGREYRWARGW
jgi:uncharacterized protein (DUF58 family)